MLNTLREMAISENTDQISLAAAQISCLSDFVQNQFKKTSQQKFEASTSLPNLVLAGDETPIQKKPSPEITGEENKESIKPVMDLKSKPGTENPGETMDEPELNQTIDAKSWRAIMKDVDLYPAIINPDGSATYTVVQAGITDRSGRKDSIDYYSRAVKVTVPADKANLNNCRFEFEPRTTISKEQFEKLLEKDKSSSQKIDLYAHGVFTNAKAADKEALLLQLSSGRPTIVLDWTADYTQGDKPAEKLGAYKRDTIAAKQANDNREFQTAIDNTIKQIGADNTGLIGFSHGGFFDVRYLSHRVARGLPKLDIVLLAHPDVPISAAELQVNGKTELLKDASKHSYVIGSRADLELRLAAVASLLLPGTPTYENGASEERLGSNSDTTRTLIESEGAMPISESDRSGSSREHFLNYAGIAQLLAESRASLSEAQRAYIAATDTGRQRTH